MQRPDGSRRRNGRPGGSQTPGFAVRSGALCSTELRAVGAQARTRTEGVVWLLVGQLQSPLCDPRKWWMQIDLNNRSPDYRSGALAGLSYASMAESA